MNENNAIPEVGSASDKELEQKIKKWEALGPEIQRQRLSKVTESFGVGGP
jgi:hypothetical protein